MTDDRDRPDRGSESPRPAPGPGVPADGDDLSVSGTSVDGEELLTGAVRGTASGDGAAGDDEGGLAPVIPLFGATRSASSVAIDRDATGRDATGWGGAGRDGAVRDVRPRGRTTDDADATRDDAIHDDTDEWHPTWTDEPRGRAAHPSTGAFRTVQTAPRDEEPTAERFRARGRLSASAPISLFPARGRSSGGAGERRRGRGDGALDPREQAESLLLRKLRTRSLSLSEARTAVRAVEGADDAIVEELIHRFVDLGYLDDAALAEQLVLSATERRGDGRRVVMQTLAKRGIPRDVAEAAVGELPDDDEERALDLARAKIRGVEGRDFDTALRRLAAQLARRGYSSSVALRAARQALDENGVGRSRPRRPPTSGVRFTPDD